MPLAPPAIGGKELHSTAVQGALLKLLLKESTPNAIGVACSYLLHVALNQPEVLRRVMNEKVIQEGFAGRSLLDVINRACK